MLEELPSELLRCIAGHMSNAEWARVRGTCQRFSQVQLCSISVSLPNIASLRWCTRLWQEAESIALSLNQLDQASSDLSQVSAPEKAEQLQCSHRGSSLLHVILCTSKHLFLELSHDQNLFMNSCCSAQYGLTGRNF